MNTIKCTAVFSRLETDREFRARVYNAKRPEMNNDQYAALVARYGKDLDDLVWDAWKMQRRIVEGTA